MTDWNANLYLQFGNERTQPAIDLAARIMLEHPHNIVDIGCGPGNSAAVLRRRWPEAVVLGVDSSPEMILAARKDYPAQEWIQADAASWQATVGCDLIFSNAALQWIPRHDHLLKRLFSFIVPGGALAFQIPTHDYSVLHKLILEVASEKEWAHLMLGAKQVFTIESPYFYYDVLSAMTVKLDIWETEYFHEMANTQAIISWISGTGLRPFLQALEKDKQRQRFIKMLGERVDKAYQPQANGKVLFPFRRLFVIAYK
jgi:trans-aconitate 2-methyltransferase